MKIIDMNLCVGCRDSEGKLINLDYLLSLMEDYCICYGTCYHMYAKVDPREGNRIMAQLSAHSGGKIGVCAVLDPILGKDNLLGTGSLKERLEQFQPEAIRVFPDECRVPFDPFYWNEILDAVNALKLPLIIDCGYSGDFLVRLPDIADKYPNIKFILLGQGCCNSRVIIPLLTDRSNVFFTIERMTDNLQLEEINEICGCGKLLFGSGYPARPHAGALGLVLYADIPMPEREKILYKNWEAIRG